MCSGDLGVLDARGRLRITGRKKDLIMLAAHPAVRQELEHAVERVNTGRAPVERVKAWRILPRDLTIVSGELTPTLKARREVVTGRFHELVDEMYARSEHR